MDNQSIAHTRWDCTYHIVRSCQVVRVVLLDNLVFGISAAAQQLQAPLALEFFDYLVCLIWRNLKQPADIFLGDYSMLCIGKLHYKLRVSDVVNIGLPDILNSFVSFTIYFLT